MRVNRAPSRIRIQERGPCGWYVVDVAGPRRKWECGLPGEAGLRRSSTVAEPLRAPGGRRGHSALAGPLGAAVGAGIQRSLGKRARRSARGIRGRGWATGRGGWRGAFAAAGGRVRAAACRAFTAAAQGRSIHAARVARRVWAYEVNGCASCAPRFVPSMPCNTQRRDVT